MAELVKHSLLILGDNSTPLLNTDVVITDAVTATRLRLYDAKGNLTDSLGRVNTGATGLIEFYTASPEAINVKVVNASGKVQPYVTSGTVLPNRILPDTGQPTDKLLVIRNVAGVPMVFEQMRDQLLAGATGLTPEQAAFVDAAVDTTTVDNFCRWCVPGKNISGTTFTDVSGQGNHATIGATNSAPFANPGKLSTVAAVSGGVTAPFAASAINLFTDSFIYSVAFRRATPATNEIIMALGAGSGSGSPGLYVSHRTTGGVLLALAKGDGTLVSSIPVTAQLYSNAEGTLESVLTVMYDAPTRTVRLCWNGVIVYTGVGLMTGGNAFTTGLVTRAARLGGNGDGSTFASQFRGWQFYVFPSSSLPTNIEEVAALLGDAPSVRLWNHQFVIGA